MSTDRSWDDLIEESERDIGEAWKPTQDPRLPHGRWSAPSSATSRCRSRPSTASDDPWVCTVKDRDGKDVGGLAVADRAAVRVRTLAADARRAGRDPLQGAVREGAGGPQPVPPVHADGRPRRAGAAGLPDRRPELEPGDEPAAPSSEPPVDADVVEEVGEVATMIPLLSSSKTAPSPSPPRASPSSRCGPRSKVPIHARWPELGMLDTGTVRLEWRRAPRTRTSGCSAARDAFDGEGLTIIDVDQPDGPAAWLELAGVPIQEGRDGRDPVRRLARLVPRPHRLVEPGAGARGPVDRPAVRRAAVGQRAGPLPLDVRAARPTRGRARPAARLGGQARRRARGATGARDRRPGSGSTTPSCGSRRPSTSGS